MVLPILLLNRKFNSIWLTTIQAHRALKQDFPKGFKCFESNEAAYRRQKVIKMF